MLTFAPVSRTDNYVTLSFTDLCQRHDYGDRVGSLKGSLKDGDLVAYVQIEGDARFWQVPRAHWAKTNQSLEGEPGETLFCWGSSDVPVQFRDRPLLFFLNEVEDWEKDEPSEQVDGVTQEASGSDEDDWLSSPELLRLNPNAPAVEARLRRLFDHGLLRIKVRSAKLKVKWRDRTESDWLMPSGNLGELGAAYKSFSIDLFNDTLLAIVRSRSPGSGPDSNISALGLSFARRDIVAGLPEWQRDLSNVSARSNEKAGEVSQPGRDKGGAPTDASKWANLVAVVAAIFANRDIVDGSPPKKAALRNIIEGYAATVGLPIASRGTIDPAIEMIIKTAWADHKDGQPLFGADGLPLSSDNNLQL